MVNNGQGSTSMNSNQIVDKLNNDLDFAINFIIDNNPQEVEANITSLSIPLSQNPSNLQLKEVISELLQESSNDKAVEQINYIISVPYLNNATNYTGGFESYFQSQLPPDPTGRESGGAEVIIAQAIGSIFDNVGLVWGSYKQEDILQVQQQIQNDNLAFQLEKIERTKIFGIPQAVFISVIVFVMFVVLILFLTNRK